MKRIKKILPYLINSLLCVAIFLIALYICDNFPFGEYTIGKSDAIVQFKPMLYNFITELKTKTIELYSFNNGLGNPFVFNFLYYLSSPLNLVAIFFKDANSMYLSVIITKLIITSIIMTFYTKKKLNNNFLTTIITLTYVFSSWFIAYYYYLPWLDIFMIFPLFNYGLEKILNQKKPYIYIFTLAYAILTNFYLSFTIIFYTIIYFIIYEI
ncbi:MAG TPA: YfhO family protein, partial [Candidatus Coprovivens excrementavium]|nr:YfhO family protein [Candidatus Coprovivens excrementavium]